MADIKRGRLVLFLVGSTLLITFTFYTWQILYTPNILVDLEPRTFLIEKGTTFRKLQEELGKDRDPSRWRYVNDMVSFSFLARLMDYDKTIRPGLYALKPNMSNLEAIEMLRGGEQVPVKVTFTNVRLLEELPAKITKNTALPPADFEGALNDYIATNNDGFNADNALCMFIPNTYEVYFDVSATELVARMKYEYDIFWNEERKAQAAQRGLTPIEVSILASIVQAESVKPDESKTIAGLYLNRLKKGIPLQADPTLVFAVGDFTLKRVLNVHKEVNSPYNTYMHAGLPPGPINMPSIRSIDAVLQPEMHNYIYMCAKEDFSGNHNFAATLTEHNRNAARYQRALSIEIQKGKAARRKNR
jgi:UPF0755 protein